MPLERMADFFNACADGYDDHMLIDLALDKFYEEITHLVEINHEDFCLLDLGCGTGLELNRLFEKYPSVSVTGIDLSANMLEKLKEKYPYKSLRLLCGSYFDLSFGGGYDVALSTYSLHHLKEEEKLFLYRKIYTSVNENGVFIEGDYIANSLEKQIFHLSELDRLKREQNIHDGEFFHYDIPLTVETQVRLLNEAGFSDVKIARQWDNTGIFVAKR